MNLLTTEEIFNILYGLSGDKNEFTRFSINEYPINCYEEIRQSNLTLDEFIEIRNRYMLSVGKNYIDKYHQLVKLNEQKIYNKNFCEMLKE